jgi:DNA modification methylase
MTVNIYNGNCLDEMKKLADKSINLMICDLPYGETNCKWDIKIDMVEFWTQFKRVRKHDRVACIHFCSTKFGYELIKSWEKGFKMDMVWKKRNKTGGLQSRHRPMRNHEMVYFFYDKCPKYNRDTYHKRILTMPKVAPNPASVINEVEEKTIYNIDKDKTHPKGNGQAFDPPNPASVINEVDTTNYMGKTVKQVLDSRSENGKKHLATFDPPNPASVVNEVEEAITSKKRDVEYSTRAKEGKDIFGNNDTQTKPFNYDPPNPASVINEDELIEPAEDEPKSMYESGKVFIGKRHHQTEKPLDILEFFIKYWTDEGDTILDPTMGSGSTAVASIGLKRNFIGYELDPKIFKVAEERIKKGK